MKLLRLIKLFRVKHTSAYDVFELLNKFVVLTEGYAWFLKFFFCFAGVTHVLACIWIIVGRYVNSEDHLANNPDLTKG